MSARVMGRAIVALAMCGTLAGGSLRISRLIIDRGPRAPTAAIKIAIALGAFACGYVVLVLFMQVAFSVITRSRGNVLAWIKASLEEAARVVHRSL
jgi:hypothetical protein